MELLFVFFQIPSLIHSQCPIQMGKDSGFVCFFLPLGILMEPSSKTAKENAPYSHFLFSFLQHFNYMAQVFLVLRWRNSSFILITRLMEQMTSVKWLSGFVFCGLGEDMQWGESRPRHIRDSKARGQEDTLQVTQGHATWAIGGQKSVWIRFLILTHRKSCFFVFVFVFLKRAVNQPKLQLHIFVRACTCSLN